MPAREQAQYSHTAVFETPGVIQAEILGPVMIHCEFRGGPLSSRQKTLTSAKDVSFRDFLGKGVSMSHIELHDECRDISELTRTSLLSTFTCRNSIMGP